MRYSRWFKVVVALLGLSIPPASAQWEGSGIGISGGSGGGGGSGSGTVQSGSSPAVAQYQGATTTTVGPATVSGDATLAAGGALTITKISGVTLTLGGPITLPAAPASTQCLHISNAGAVTATGSDCAGATYVTYVGTAAGTNTYTLSPSPSGYSLVNQYVIAATFANTNTGASTLNVNSTGALPVVTNTDSGLTALIGGEIIGGLEYYVSYSTSAATACASSCYVLATVPQTAVVAGTTQTVSATQWSTCAIFEVTTSSQTLTLPVSSGLSTNGCIVVNTIGQSVTLTPNAADAINGGSAGASVTIASGFLALVNKSSAGNLSVSPNPALIAAGSCTSCNLTYDAAGRVTVAATGAAVGATSGYISGDWYGMWPHAGLNTTQGQNTTEIYCSPNTIYAAVHIDSLGLNIETGQAASNAQLAIYNSGTNGLPSTLIGSTGNIATTSTATVTGSITGGPFALTPGNYWFCAITNNGSTVADGQIPPTQNLGYQPLESVNTTAASFYTNRNATNGFIGYMGQTFGTWPNLSGASITAAPAMWDITWHISSIP